jgi:hypothetical protein
MVELGDPVTVEGSVDLESRSSLVVRVWSFALPGAGWGPCQLWDSGGQGKGTSSRMSVSLRLAWGVFLFFFSSVAVTASAPLKFVVRSVGGNQCAGMHAATVVGIQGPWRSATFLPSTRLNNNI